MKFSIFLFYYQRLDNIGENNSTDTKRYTKDFDHSLECAAPKTLVKIYNRHFKYLKATFVKEGFQDYCVVLS